MAFAEPRSVAVAHKNTFRVSSIEGGATVVLWEGDSLGDGEAVAERLAQEARAAGSQATIVFDGFRLSIEKQWVHRLLTSRPPSVSSIDRLRRTPQRILFLPLEFPTWNAGGHSWSYGAGLAYEAALKDLGHEVTTINTAVAPYAQKLLKGRRFDQVWLHCHPRHLADFATRSWVAELAPVRLLLCGETVTYEPGEVAASPWFAEHRKAFEAWLPFVTHAAMVDPADVARVKGPRALWWQQAVPKSFVAPVNETPKRERAVFVGTLYPPRDRWVWDVGGSLEQVESPESEAFCALFEKSHEWIQRALGGDPSRAPWGASLRLRLYNFLQSRLRQYAMSNFLSVLKDGVAVVSLPSMVKTYSGRVIEGIAAGRPVLTQALPDGHPVLFEDGKEILHYRSPEELAAKIAELKADPDRAVQIARAATAALLKGHTTEVRTADLLAFTSKAGG